MKKRFTTESAETPIRITITTNVPTYNITQLLPAMSYEISLLVDTFDYGQSEWSDQIMVQTKSLVESNPSEVDQLKILMVIIFGLLGS